MEAFPVPIPLPVQRPPFTYKGKLKDYKIWTDKCYWALIWSSVYFFAILIDMPSPQLSVSRQSLFEDSFHQIMRLPAYELRRRLYIIFRWDYYPIMVMKMLINDDETSCLWTAEGSILYSGKIIFWSWWWKYLCIIIMMMKLPAYELGRRLYIIFSGVVDIMMM